MNEVTQLSAEEKATILANKAEQIIAEIMGAKAEGLAEGEEPKGMDAIKMQVRKMHSISLVHAVLSPIIKKLDEYYDQLRKKDIPDLMQENDVRTVTFEGIGRVQLAGDCYASIPAENQEVAFAWLRDNNYGDLIKETVNSSTLKAWAKEGLEQGRELPEVSEGVPVFRIEPYTRASIVKVRGGKKQVSE